MRLVFLAALALALFGCPPASDKAASDGGSPAALAKPLGCAKVGDSCEFAPGKLGSCVHVDDCTNEPCLVCQSQH